MSTSVNIAWQSTDYRKSADATASVATVRYVVIGATDEPAVITAVEDYLETHSDTEYEGISQAAINVAERVSDDKWIAEVVYSNSNSGGGGGSVGDSATFSASVGVTTFRQTTATNTVYKSTNTTRLSNFLINDGEGVEVNRSTLSFAMTVYLSSVGATLMKTIAEMAQHVNSAKFQGFAIGEIKFEGAEISQINRHKYQVTYQFSYSPDQGTVTCVNGLGTLSNVKGWEYVWYHYEPRVTTSGTTKYTTNLPTAAYKTQIYPTADLNDLPGL